MSGTHRRYPRLAGEPVGIPSLQGGEDFKKRIWVRTGHHKNSRSDDRLRPGSHLAPGGLNEIRGVAFVTRCTCCTHHPLVNALVAILVFGSPAMTRTRSGLPSRSNFGFRCLPRSDQDLARVVADIDGIGANTVSQMEHSQAQSPKDRCAPRGKSRSSS